MTERLKWDGDEVAGFSATSSHGEYLIVPAPDHGFKVKMPSGWDENGRYSLKFARVWAQFDLDERNA